MYIVKSNRQTNSYVVKKVNQIAKVNKITRKVDVKRVGRQGIQGEKGDTGETGPQGLKGDKGDQGIQGLQGVQGIPGEKGDKGDQGIQGIQGKKGDKGDKGDTGAPGVVQSLTAGANINIDNTDPSSPIISSTSEPFNGTLSTTSGNITIDPADGTTNVDGTMNIVAPGTTNTPTISITNMGAGSTGINMSRNSGGASMNIGHNSGGIYGINATNGGGLQIWARGNGGLSTARAALLFATDPNAANGSMATMSIQTANNAKPVLLGLNASGTVTSTITATGDFEGSSVVLKSPDGSRWRLSVDDTGTLSTSAA